MYTIKWSVMQYVIVRPLVSIAGIITNALGLYCESGGINFHFSYVYLSIVDFISITVALYGLFTFYQLTKEELEGRRPLAKFLAIKLIVFATFYQGFVFEILEKTGTIKASTYWSATNVANGLSALCLCIEMVFFSLFMMWAYPASEYKDRNKGIKQPVWRGILDTFNYSDFILESLGSLWFFVRYVFRRPGTHGVKNLDGSSPDTTRPLRASTEELRRGDEDDTNPFEPRIGTTKTFGQAFGVDPTSEKRRSKKLEKGTAIENGGTGRSWEIVDTEQDGYPPRPPMREEKGEV